MNAKQWASGSLAIVMLLSAALLGCSNTDAAVASNIEVSGVVIGGGDTTPPDGPLDAPRKYIYEVQREDGTSINVGYTAYPPSPAGDAARSKITLEFDDGTIDMGDYLEARGTFDPGTDTITVADQGDYIKALSERPNS